MITFPFQKLLIWQKGMDLVDLIYIITGSFPRTELYGLISQMRRSAVSIPSNIAEGSQRVSQKEFSNFILIAKGSLAELYTQTMMAKRQKFMNEEKFLELELKIVELDKMLRSFYLKLVSSQGK